MIDAPLNRNRLRIMILKQLALFWMGVFLFTGNALLGEEAEDTRVPPTRPNPLKVAEAGKPEKPMEADVERTRATVTPAKEKEPKRIGPYRALTYDEEILQEVVYRESDNTVWLRLRPEKRNEEIVVKISNQKFANYRKWFTTDDFELVSPANSGKQPNALTDWLTTQARFIEYSMNGDLFLHLERVEN